MISAKVRLAMSRVFRSGTDMTDEDFSTLFEYYTDNGEMPYGTAKARDGDPYEWIANRIQNGPAYE